MNARTLAIIAAATVALVIIATLVTLSGTGAGPELPDRIAPGLYERSSEIERIRVATAEGETVLERDRSNTEPDETEGEGDEQQTERWIIADPYHGYPADPARVGALLRTLAELEPAERRTANPENHDLLGVQTVGEGEPRPDGTARVTLTDAEGQTIADLILGERAQTGRYARRAGENQTWLTAGAASVPSGSRRYLPSPVVEIPSARIESIAIEPAAGEGVTIRRTTDPETDTPFTVTGLPDGAELNSDANDILSRIVSSLSFVTPRDVLPDDEAPAASERTSTSIVRTTDGLTLAVSITPIADGRGGRATEAWVRMIPSRATADNTENDNAERISDAAFDALERRLEGWALRLSGPMVDRLRTPARDLILEQPAPGAPPEPPASH